MYPRVSVDLLLADEWQNRFRRYFLDSGEFIVDPFQILSCTSRPQRKCVSVCLFKRSVDNHFANELKVDDLRWRTKYWNRLKSLTNEMNDFPEWKLRIYTELDLWDEVTATFADHSNIELYQMRVNSVGAIPGMLWRFIALADCSLDVVLAADIDEPLATKTQYIQSFEMNTWSAIGRIGSFTSDRKYLVNSPHSPIKNYPTMIGSCNMSRPARFDFDLIAAMRGFMAYRRYGAESNRPWAYAANEDMSVYNQPIGKMIYGWGSHWYAYGFDERFLKHVIYYHFAEKGTIHTWAPNVPPSKMEPEGLCDLEFVRARGNTTVYSPRAVRLASLKLSSDALRIAFLIEEHYWIFESLLAIMHQHAHGSCCGNIFFHEMDNPRSIELVPKQLNLFQCARYASKVCEIGFNAGHSAAIMLLANSNLTVRAFEMCNLAYTKPCYEFLNSVFGKRIVMVEGNSGTTVPADIEKGYDLVYIDGNHDEAAVARDLANSLPKCIDGAIVVMDDYEGSNGGACSTKRRKDLVPTDMYTMRKVFPGSSHAIFHYLAKPREELTCSETDIRPC